MRSIGSLALGVVAAAGIGCDYMETTDEASGPPPTEPPAVAEPARQQRPGPAVRLEAAREDLAGLAQALGVEPPELDADALDERYPEGWVAFAWRGGIVDHVQHQGSRFHLPADRVTATLEAGGGLFLQLSVYDGLNRTQVQDLLVRVDFPPTGRGTRPVALRGAYQVGVEVLSAQADRALFAVGVGVAQ